LSENNILETVTNQLVELKDTSELAMDLAYSSLLLNNNYLAGHPSLQNGSQFRLNYSDYQWTLPMYVPLVPDQGLIYVNVSSERGA